MNNRSSSPSAGVAGAFAFRAHVDAIQREADTMARAFVVDVLNVGAAHRYDAGAQFSRTTFEDPRGQALLRFSAPRELGGDGRDDLDWGLLLEQLAYRVDDVSWVYAVSMQVRLAMTIAAGGPYLKEAFSLPMIRGEKVVGLALWEDCDYQELRTTAAREGESVVLNGEKGYVTLGEVSDAFLVFARVADSADVTAVLVPNDVPGLEVFPFRPNGSPTNCPVRLVLKDVRIPRDLTVAPSDALGLAAAHFRPRRAQSAAIILGITRRLLETMVARLQQRVRGGVPVLCHPNVSTEVGKLYARYLCARAGLHAALVDELDEQAVAQDANFSRLGSVAKIMATEQAIELSRAAMNFLGAEAYKESDPFARFSRDIGAFVVGQGAPDQLLMQLTDRIAMEVAIADRWG